MWRLDVIVGSQEENRESGFFINLYDMDTLNLYLDAGIYGFLMAPQPGEISPYSNHYAALADYACGREGTHVFFFLKRKVVYGGQLIGNKKCGCFYLNGSQSPLTRKAGAPLCWDESTRSCYEATSKEGIFKVQTSNGIMERSQPYLILFKDRLGLRGNAVVSDDLYFELGSFPYPLPTNSIQNMSFCTMTPGETRILLHLLESSDENVFMEPSESVEMHSKPVEFRPEYGIKDVSEATTESHLEASVLANPELLPRQLQPKDSLLCRQIPISPFKPSQMDRADICYYSTPVIERGTIPNTVIELKKNKAGKGEIEQVLRYAKWLSKVIGEDAKKVSYSLFAPEYTGTIEWYVPPEFREQITFHSFNEDEQLILGE